MAIRTATLPIPEEYFNIGDKVQISTRAEQDLCQKFVGLVGTVLTMHSVVGINDYITVRISNKGDFAFKCKYLDKVDAPKSTEELLLAEAYKKYPVGTKYRTTGPDPTAAGSLQTVTKQHFTFIVDDGYTVIKGETGRGFIYYGGRWAPKLSSNTPYQPPVNTGLQEPAILRRKRTKSKLLITNTK